MAYDRKKIYEQAKAAIEKHNLFFIEDLVAFIPCDKTSFYRFFPPECNEYNELKTILEENKTKTKTAIRGKLFKAGKATELLSLYRMICTPDERKAISTTYQENNIKIKEDLTDEQTQVLRNLLSNE